MKKALIFIVLITAFSCGKKTDPGFELTDGVSRELASERKERISEVKYGLSFNIPEKLEDSIPSRLALELSLTDTNRPLVLDFIDDHEQATPPGFRQRGKPEKDPANMNVAV